MPDCRGERTWTPGNAWSSYRIQLTVLPFLCRRVPRVLLVAAGNRYQCLPDKMLIRTGKSHKLEIPIRHLNWPLVCHRPEAGDADNWRRPLFQVEAIKFNRCYWFSCLVDLSRLLPPLAICNTLPHIPLVAWRGKTYSKAGWWDSKQQIIVTVKWTKRPLQRWLLSPGFCYIALFL